MIGIIKWEEPPAELYGPPRRVITHSHVAEQLKSRPGQSALVDIGCVPLDSRIKSASIAAYRPAGSFGAVSGWIGQKCHTWAWYVGQVDGDECSPGPPGV